MYEVTYTNDVSIISKGRRVSYDCFQRWVAKYPQKNQREESKEKSSHRRIHKDSSLIDGRQVT